MALFNSFTFDSSKGETPQTVAMKRAIAAQIMGQMGNRPARNVGEGIGNAFASIGNGIVANVMNRRAGAAEEIGNEAANALKQRFTDYLANGTPLPSGGIPMTSAAGEVTATSPGGGSVDLSGDRQAFIESLLPAAMEESRRTGVDPRIIVAQAAQETGWGKSAPGNNFFGIKSHGKGGGNSMMTNEVINGKTVRVRDSFRAYDSPADSVRGYGDFLLENPRYKGLRSAQGLDAQLEALQASGYATDPNYSRTVGTIAHGIQLPQDVAAMTPETAFSAVMPELGGGQSLSDEVSAFQQTPEYAAQFPGMEPQGFDAGRFGDPTFGAQPVQGREALALALANGQQQNGGQQAISDQMGGIPQQFQGSQQLMGAQGGIMPALMEGDPASGQQVADAYSRGNQSMNGNPPMELLAQMISSPFMDEGTKKLAASILEQEMQRRDPSYQLNMDYRRAQIDKLNRDASAEKRQPLINAGGGAIYDPNTGEWLRPPAEDGGNGAFRFGGNSVEAQALNGLMDSGQLTPEQAQQLGAGKTITGPNGEIIFLTPQGVFGSSPDGKTQRLSSEGIPADNSGISSGNITITEPKVTLDERKAMGFADRMSTSGALINGNEKAGLKPWDQFVRGNDWIPDFAENWLVGEDFQKFDQARRDFVNAQLRRESGAVISDEEFGNANQQYFPQPGDTEQVLKQKAQNRKVVIDGMKRDAGPTYRGIGGDPLADARKAIAAGADRNAVIQRLRQNGIDPGGL